ncbi:unnamed protein product [Mytilus coruscus]|uniref:Endonuclease/exonuclease/phosphatase domain-containing protein n=1 Tax=Mytilus coruscus TaxID=42192 RepID=A0A6J8C8Q6_MYTCO|nr:unnamed protein product [Mytilus coruscus]
MFPTLLKTKVYEFRVFAETETRLTMSSVKAANIEQILVEESNTELLVLQKSEHILLQLENISTKLEQKEKACMIKNIQKDLKSEISKVSALFQDKKSLTVEISEDYMDKLNESLSQMATNLKLETNKISSQLTKDALEILKVSEENTKKIITAVNDNTDSESSDDEDSDSNPSSTEETFAKNKEKHIQTRESIENQLSKHKDNVDKTTQDKFSDKQDYQPILNDKVSPFKQTDRNFDVDCWIIGTSVVKDLIARKIYRSKRVCITTLKEKTIRGAKAFIKTGKVSAANILLQVGSNDVDFDYDIENVAKEMRDLISFCKLSVPGSKILVGEALPRFYRNQVERCNYETKRSQFNTYLKEMEKELDIVIIEHKSGVPIYVRNIKEKLNTILGINYLHETQPRQHGQVQGNKYQNNGTKIIDIQKTRNFIYDPNRDNRRGYRENYKRYNQNVRHEDNEYNSRPRYDIENSPTYNKGGNHMNNRLPPFQENHFFQNPRQQPESYMYMQNRPQQNNDNKGNPLFERRDMNNNSESDTKSLIIQLLTNTISNDDFQNLENEIVKFSVKGEIALIGDFNARVSDHTDFINQESYDSPVLQDILPPNYDDDIFVERNSQYQTVNCHGKSLLNMCISSRLRILNGRFIGDSLEAKTTNPQEFWKLLKEANSYTHKNINTPSNDNFQPKNLMKHFQSQGDWVEPENKTHIEEIENFLSDLNNYKDNNITDKPITITEVKRVIKTLKVGKSCGPDLILNEIKTSCPVIVKSVAILFNLIFLSGFYPET